MAPIKLMLVDDHEIVRTGLRMMLEAEADLEIVSEAESGEEALELVSHNVPDVIIMDVSLPGIGGVEATRVLRDRYPDIKVLVLTIHEDERYFFQMLNAGAAGYLPKPFRKEQLTGIVRHILGGIHEQL